MNNTILKSAVVLALSIMMQCNVSSQSGVVIDVPDKDTLLLKGEVNVLHCPNHYYKDTTVINYDKYVIIFKEDGLVKYFEIFDSANRDSCLISSFSFEFENDTMYFFSEADFLDFTGFGKTMFLSYSDKGNTMKITPRVLIPDSTTKFDFNFFEFQLDSKEDIKEKSRKFSIYQTETGKRVKIEMSELRKLSSSFEGKTVYYNYDRINKKSITGEIDSSGFYSSIVIDEVTEFSKKESTCTFINSIYKRIVELPERISASLR